MHPYSFNIKVNKIKAPMKKNTIVGMAEVIDNEGNILSFCLIFTCCLNYKRYITFTRHSFYVKIFINI